MRQGKLKSYLKSWQDAHLITEEQAGQIAGYMKAESHRQFLRLVRVLFIVGAFWLVIGFVATIKLINIEILRTIAQFFYQIVRPLITLARSISPDHYQALLAGFGCLIAWGLFHILGVRLRKKSEQEQIQLGQLQEKELRLGTSSLTIGYIAAAIAWQCFNNVISPLALSSHPVSLPWFSFAGVIFFLTLAYRMKDQIALLFGIGFTAQSVGLFTAYTFASYWIAVQMPVIQMLVGVLMLFIGLWHIEKVKGREEHFEFLFGRTYEWTGLLFIYLALWMMSIWGITRQEHAWMPAPDVELWIGNLLFIAACLASLFYGAAHEDRMFFNFGLTFFIIESYTLFFSHVWATLGTAVGSLILGFMLIATGYVLRKLWLRGAIFPKP